MVLIFVINSLTLFIEHKSLGSRCHHQLSLRRVCPKISSPLVFFENFAEGLAEISARFLDPFPPPIRESIKDPSPLSLRSDKPSFLELFKRRVNGAWVWSSPPPFLNFPCDLLPVHLFFGKKPQYEKRKQPPHVTTLRLLHFGASSGHLFLLVTQYLLRAVFLLDAQYKEGTK